MPYGAHETMEMHEILMEKINCITHFNLYAGETNNPQILDMIARHQQEEIASYNEIVAYTRGRNEFQPLPSNTDIRGIGHHQIQYGLNNPPQYAPQSDARLSDREILTAMLFCHKNGARNSNWAALECADPNLRMLLLNCSATCVNQAYEVFLFMNQQGLYQVPTLNSQTAQTFLHSYQPADESLQAQFAQYGAAQSYGGSTGYGSDYASSNPSFQTGSRNSVLYGGGTGASVDAGINAGVNAAAKPGAGTGNAYGQFNAAPQRNGYDFGNAATDGTIQQ